MANPVGEDSWLAYVEEESRHATDLEGRVKIVELFKSAVNAEPASLSIWLAYCEYFWSLFLDCQTPDAGWSHEEQLLGRDLFSFDTALSLWSDGYDAIKYRISDSHLFWDRWVAIELDQLARTRTPSGVKRISHLYRDRLQVPHATWDNTSQMFSSFLSTYNNAAYESEFKDVTASAQEAKAAYDRREPRELELARARRAGDQDAQKAIMEAYLDWEMAQLQDSRNRALDVAICLALYARALGSLFAFDDKIWSNLAVYLSALHRDFPPSQLYQPLPNMLEFFQRATAHCPWSGALWSRYILTAEELGWSFHSVESIKHAATNSKALDKHGMPGVLDMYTAWCGFLKRTAMNPSAPEDAVDVAEVGLLAALEDVDLWGKRLYKDAYQGDPNYRLERILIQYLTEVKCDISGARNHWTRMSNRPLLANSYDFWLNHYLWEMMVYASRPRPRSPTPATSANDTKPMRVPDIATSVLQRAISQPSLDWPERVMDVYLQHCNDYERPDTLQRAVDSVYQARKAVAKRRERENADAAAAYAAQAQQAQAQEATPATQGTSGQDSPSSVKRKREETPGEVADGVSKRARNTKADGADDAGDEQTLKRDRENTSVMVTNLPPDVTQTAIRKYFREYGHINSLALELEEGGNSSSALIEFRSPEDVQSALLRDNKYFGQHQIRVKPGTGLTIFVSNYPPTADETYIRNLFKDCGKVFNVRWPSLKYKTTRRFCYVSFRDADAANKATQMDGKLLEGKFKLQSKYSDPAHKKEREGAVAEGREVRVKNVDSATQENDLRSVFGKYGKVANVRIIKNMGGQNLGTAYIVFETKEQAQKALDLDQTKFKSRILEVEVSKETNFKPFATSKGDRGPTASPSPAPGDHDVTMSDGPTEGQGSDRHPTPAEIQARTMAVMNVPDTVNDARVRAVAEKYGAIVKLVLRPDHQGAIIEFADAGTAGRAALGLEGFEMVPGRKLRTGTVKDLFKEKDEKRQDRIVPKDSKRDVGNKKTHAPFMPPPQTVRRPALGQAGAKRGLGFVASKADKKEGVQGPSPSPTVNGTGAPRSNADFKAMFLGSAGEAPKEETKTNGTGAV
ncbi:hypothetical protein F4780DRAFT_509682 [Xylariomycetidae sp. FL0641]|nr:hypothetical protein F4780DRAFT_509682 [Xylariomycetidae sp. FL0641]